MSAVTVDELKAKLGIPAEPPDPALDARLQSIIDETQALVEGYLGVPVEPTPLYMERGCGIDYAASVVLPVYPVISLDKVMIGNEEQALEDFWLDRADGMFYPADGCGCRRWGCCFCVPGPLQVDYTAGFDPVPADLHLALLNLSASYYQANAANVGHVLGGGDKVKHVTLFGAMSISFDATSAPSSASSTSGLEVPSFLQGWTWILDKYQVRTVVVE